MPDISDLTALKIQLATLEERMNTVQAETESAFERLRADLAGRDTAFERLRADFAQRDAARATRETWLVVFLVATVIGASGLVIAIPGVLIGQ